MRLECIRMPFSRAALALRALHLHLILIPPTLRALQGPSVLGSKCLAVQSQKLVEIFYMQEAKSYLLETERKGCLEERLWCGIKLLLLWLRLCNSECNSVADCCNLITHLWFLRPTFTLPQVFENACINFSKGWMCSGLPGWDLK